MSTFWSKETGQLDTPCGWAGGSVSAGRWESPAPFCMQELLLAHFCLRNIFLGARESCPLRDLYWWLWIPTSASTIEVTRFTVRYQKYQGLSWLSQWMTPSMRVFIRKPQALPTSVIFPALTLTEAMTFKFHSFSFWFETDYSQPGSFSIHLWWGSPRILMWR